MKIELTQFDLKTLQQDKKGLYFYTIKTKTGVMKVEGIKTVEEALRSAEEHLKEINKSHLSKTKIKK
jgi:hypothetical protein